MKKFALPIVLLASLLGISACQTVTDPSTEKPTETSETDTETLSQSETDISTETETASETESTTETDTSSETTEPEVVFVTSVSLNEKSKTINVGDEFTLNATVLPSNATNKNLTWKSSNTSVATVTNGKVKGVSKGSTTITVTTVDGKKTSSCAVAVNQPAADEADYTILIYLCGSDLESGYDPDTKKTNTQSAGLATLNLKEILSVNIPSNINIAIETGGARAWASSGLGIKNDKIGRWHVEGKSLVNDEQLTKASMGTSSTFQSFMEWGLKTYPAKKTGLIFWNHGGATDGCCNDEWYNSPYGDSLTAKEYKTGLEAALKNVGQTEKLEWVGYDCCLMQFQDLAAYNAEHFNYMVASQETEPGEGWDYDNWIDDIVANPKIESSELLGEIADTFVKKCEDSNKEYADYLQEILDAGYAEYYGYTEEELREEIAFYRDYNDGTLSVLDLSKMDAYVEAWESMTTKLSITSSSKWSSLKKIILQSQQFGYYDDDYGYAYDVYDTDDFLNNLQKSSTFKSCGADTVLAALNELVIHNTVGKDSAGACGLCFVAKVNGYANLNNISFSAFSSWLKINQTYGSSY